MKFPAVCLLFLFTGSNRAQIPASPQTLEVAMRDGIRLSTDVYGSTPGVRWPALLMRTPCNKRGRRPRPSVSRQQAMWRSCRIRAGLSPRKANTCTTTTTIRMASMPSNGSFSSLGRTATWGCGGLRTQARSNGWLLRTALLARAGKPSSDRVVQVGALFRKTGISSHGYIRGWRRRFRLPPTRELALRASAGETACPTIVRELSRVYHGDANH